MSLFNGEYRNPANDLLAEVLGIQLPAPLADRIDAIHEAEEAERAQDRRNRISDLTDGQLDDHQDALTTLARDVRGGEGDTRDQIADAIERVRDDLQETREQVAS